MEEHFDILWEGTSGRELGFYILALDPEVRLIEDPGIYIAARKLKSGIWEPLSIGRTDSLDEAMRQQSDHACIRRHHGSHLHVRPTKGDRSADDELVTELLEMWNPVCGTAA